jgi:AbiV family abortive infection protein
MHKSRLSQAMRACVENGQRLHQDAERLGLDNRSATAVALCILAQEEFAKAFLLHLVCEGIIPWTAKVRESLRNHKHKQIIGLIMEWLSSSNDIFGARMNIPPGTATIPLHVADAVKLYVKKVLPQGHIYYPSAAIDPIAKNVAAGDRDKAKQDSLYVRLSEDGNVISVPSSVTAETVEAELERTKRLSDLVDPLREGALGPVLDYDLLVETMRFLLLDKRNRPFLLLGESKFGGPATSPTGTTWLHSIEVLIENVSDEQASHVNGYASLSLDKEPVKPSFFCEEFVVDPHTTDLWTLSVSEETYASALSPSREFNLYIHFEYHGLLPDRKYHASIWSTYDPSGGAFRETFADLQESMIDGSQSFETKWRRPTTG